jgi:4-amino-4-deoxy-L-arabinose transferase-like glycosyltransferase
VEASLPAPAERRAAVRDADPAWLAGRTVPWTSWQRLALAGAVVLGVLLRGWDLSAEGFADDEVHKWLAAGRYLSGDLGGDDLEHPMVMKWLIVLARLALGGSTSPEAITRLPNVLAGGLSVLAIALAGRRLFGRAAGCIAAALAAVAPTFVGYGRLAKEDTLCTLFLVLIVWCVAEAQAAATDARDRDRVAWEWRAAAWLGLMFASKYFLFHALVPLAAYAWLRAAGSPWFIPVRRWVALLGLALLVFLPLDFVVLRPSTWRYIGAYLRGDAIEDRMTSESVLFMGRHFANFAFQLRGGAPLSYWPVFAAVKLAPPTVLLAAAGLLIALARRRPAHCIVLAWIGMWSFSFTVASVKYGRYFLSVLPALLLLASAAAVGAGEVLPRAWTALGRRPPGAARRALVAALAAALVVTEAVGATRLAPHYRLYVSPLGGGERNLGWFFPQCDYADAGAREAIQRVAAHAEPGAEVASEIVWPVRFYLEQAGRPDLLATHMSASKACLGGHPCYVLVQEGRAYWHNLSALERLAARVPWHVERVRAAPVVKVYRLAPDERLFTGP